MKSNFKSFLGIPVLCVAFFAASCGNDDNVNLPKSQSAQQSNPQVNSAQAAKDQENSRITLAVRQELDKDEVLSPIKIEVATSDGIVSLRGNVPSQQVADRAEQVAEGVSGVRTVHSFLKVGNAENS